MIFNCANFFSLFLKFFSPLRGSEARNGLELMAEIGFVFNSEALANLAGRHFGVLDQHLLGVLHPQFFPPTEEVLLQFCSAVHAEFSGREAEILKDTVHGLIPQTVLALGHPAFEPQAYKIHRLFLSGLIFPLPAFPGLEEFQLRGDP